MKDELVYMPISEIERVENVKTCCMLLSEFSCPFKTVVMYNTERKEKKSASLRYFVLSRMCQFIGFWFLVPDGP